MSDTAIAVVIVPVLMLLTLVLEGTRVGCCWLSRSYRTRRARDHGHGSSVQREQSEG